MTINMVTKKIKICQVINLILQNPMLLYVIKFGSPKMISIC
ncbi:unnamed protein product [Schistosoma curassoni]|uniref:Uncharacterized protein n=1 Tax=Schistosoma curassoni TaxID=6186 RepID=A0A183L6N8_9TREM|nr:unnamed protein product [Schistosoma curassoni]